MMLYQIVDLDLDGPWVPIPDDKMLVRVESTVERRFGIEVDAGDGPVRPIWRVIEVRIPEGEIPAAEWNRMTFDERREFLKVGEDSTP